MKTALCFVSVHHGNTRKVAEAMALEGGLELMDLKARPPADLSGYDCVGLASGVYGFRMHRELVEFARRHLPAGKPVFFVCTCGAARGRSFRALEELARERGCPVVGEFSCRGYDTFGPFRLVGGIAKGRPDQRDLERARRFFRELPGRLKAGEGE